MDHGAGWKDSAFSWAMGELILARIGAGETLKAITADPRMPAYATVYRWVRVHPDFAEAFGAVRAAVAAERQRVRAARRVASAEARTAARAAAGKPPRHWVSGRRSTYTPERGAAVCAAVSDGASLSAVVARPGAPSFRAIYRWLQNEPAFRDAYREACGCRAFRLSCAIDDLALSVAGMAVAPAAARRRITYLEGRIGRMTPKTYRA